MSFLRKELFENFESCFYDAVIYRDKSDFWLNEKLKIKAKDQGLTLVTFKNFLAVKCFLENSSN